MKHWDTHPQPVENCYPCRISGIAFGKTAGGTDARKSSRMKQRPKKKVSK